MKYSRFAFIIILALSLLVSSCSTLAGEYTSTSSPSYTTTYQSTVTPQTTTESTQSTSINILPTPPNETKMLTVHFIDVGQGDAILIDYGNEEILIDAGSQNKGAADYISSYVDGDLELMVATHPHADHIGGLPEVLDEYVIDEIWLNGDSSTSQTYSNFMLKVNAEGAVIRNVVQGESYQIGDLTLDVLSPTLPLSSDTNNNSIVVGLRYGDIDFLFMGDAQSEAEMDMLDLVSDIDILKVGHHGSHTSSCLEFLNIVQPEIAIYCAETGNSYGHPHAETITNLNDIGAKIYGTDICGDIVLETDGIEYSIITEKIISETIAPTPTSTATTTPTTTTTTTPPASTSTSTVNVQITKIFYDGLVARTESDEYVEIKNLGSEAVDLKGWVLKDISEGYPVFTFPSYTLEPNGIIRVYTNEIHTEYGGFSFASGSSIWNNSEPDIAALYNAQGVMVSQKSY